MLVYTLIAIVAVIVGWWGLDRLKTASAATLARGLKTGLGMLAVGLGVLFTLRGNLGHGISLGMLGLWLLSGAGLPWGTLPGQRRPSSGQTSRITTDHLEMELDHDTGAMRGRVLKGVFAGRPIERLAPAELALLWRDCRYADPRSAQLIEAWLDRVHPTWREDMARAENEPGAGGIMTVKEAYEILGLKPGVSDDDIRRAHRELMKRMHPDAGGSDYLAAKINEAKDVLLGQ
jgi:hypothetical protein